MQNKVEKIIVYVVSGILVVIVAILLTVIVLGSSDRSLRKQLDLGYKFLIHQEYEQAIVRFKKAIEIEPMCTDAYLGMADAYVGMGDLTMAQSTLEEAIILFEANGHQDVIVLKNKLVEIQGYDGTGTMANRPPTTMTVQQEGDNSLPYIQLKELLEFIDIYGESVINVPLNELVRKYNVPTDRFNSPEVIVTEDLECNYHFYYDTDAVPDSVIIGRTVEVAQSSGGATKKAPVAVIPILQVNENFIYALGDSAGAVPEISNGVTTFWRQSGCSDVIELLKYLGLSLSDEEWNDFLNGKSISVDTDIEKGVTMYYVSDKQQVSIYGNEIYHIFLQTGNYDFSTFNHSEAMQDDTIISTALAIIVEYSPSEVNISSYPFQPISFPQ